MFLVSQSTETILVYTIAAVLGAAILGLARSIAKFFAARRAQQEAATAALTTLSEYLFDTPADPRTRAPAVLGWTTSVNTTLATLSDEIVGHDAAPGVPAKASISTRLVNIEAELHPNSGTSMRDDVQHTARMAEDAAEYASHIAAALVVSDKRIKGVAEALIVADKRVEGVAEALVVADRRIEDVAETLKEADIITEKAFNKHAEEDEANFAKVHKAIKDIIPSR